MSAQFFADVLTFSPRRGAVDCAGAERTAAAVECHDDVPVLRLEKFNTPPKVDFGSVTVGDAKVCLLRVENITSEPQHLEIDKPRNSALGFALEDTVFEIAPACNVYLNVHWNVPADFEVGVDGRHFRETVLFKWNGKHRLSMTLVGCAVLPAAQRKKLSAALRPMAVSQRGSVASSTVIHAPASSSTSTATRIKAALTVSTAAPSSKACKAPTAAIDQENRRPIVNAAPIAAVVKKSAAVGAVEAIVAKPKTVGLSALAPKTAKPSQLAAVKGGDTDLLDALYSDSTSSAPSVAMRPASGSDHLASSMARIDESFFAPRCAAIDALSHSMLAVEGVEEGEVEVEEELELETEHDAWLSAPTPKVAHSLSSFEQRRLSGGSWSSASISQPNSPVASASQPRQLPTLQPLAHAHAHTHAHATAAATVSHKKASPLRASDDCLVSSGGKTATGGNKSAALFASASTAHAVAALSRSHGPSHPPRAFVSSAAPSAKLPPAALSIPAVPALDSVSLSSSLSASEQQQQQLQRSQLRSSALVEAIAITPRHTASRLMFFDEKWAEKQERAFTRWLNFLLDPFAAADASASAAAGFSAAAGDAKSSMSASTVAASSSNTAAAAVAAAAAPSLAFGLSLADRLADAACRRDAQALYRAPANQQVIARLEQEVELGRIALRTDSSERHFHADVGMRADSLRLFFLCVHPAWLRLAMETLFGQAMPYREAAHHALTSGAATAAAVFCAGTATGTSSGPGTATGSSATGSSATGSSGTGSMRALLQRWLLARVWACTELEAEFATQHTAGGGASHRTTFRDGYWAALGRYSLKRCLQLWHCLELLKGARTLPADPPLFAVDAPFKSLADLAQEFAQRHLRGEANLARHLAHLGAPLRHVCGGGGGGSEMAVK